MERSSSWKPWQVRIILCQTACVAMLFLSAVHQGIGGNDSIMFRAGASLCGPNLYRSDLQAELLNGHNTPFFRAPFYACMFKPLLQFDFPLAFFLVNLAAVGGVILLLPYSIGTYRYEWSPLVVLFIPLALNFSVEQDGALVLLVLSLALAAENAGLPFLCGAVLALTLEKPSLFFLLPAVIAARKQYNILSGYAAVACGLAAISYWIVGTQGIRDYVALVAGYGVNAEKMPTARGIAASLQLWSLWPVLTVPAAAATLFRARSSNFKASLCIAIVGSLFVSPQSYAHDCSTLLLPVLYFLFNGTSFQKYVSMLWLLPAAPFGFVFSAPWSIYTAFLVLLFLFAITLAPARAPGSLSASANASIACS